MSSHLKRVCDRPDSILIGSCWFLVNLGVLEGDTRETLRFRQVVVLRIGRAGGV